MDQKTVGKKDKFVRNAIKDLNKAGFTDIAEDLETKSINQCKL